MSEDDEKLDRREFLRRAGLAGLVAVGAGRYGTGCKNGGGGGKKEKSAGVDESASAGGAEKGGGELSCDDTSGLEKGEIQTRKSLKYVDHTDKPDKTCANCKLYKPPKEKGTCGTCTTVPGPIHPDGYCTAWVKKG